MKTKENALTKKMMKALSEKVSELVRVLRDNELTVGFAESCTGGLLSSLMTEQAGVSDVFMGSVVSYDNKVKQNFLKVSKATLKNEGAVSSDVAKQMAEGALKNLEVSVAASITGVAGPSGGSKEKPVGTVFISVAGFKSEKKKNKKMKTIFFKHKFEGNRKEIQLQACGEAIQHLIQFLKQKDKQ